MHIKDGKRFNPNTQYTHNGVTYPHLTSFPAVMVELGITEIAEPSAPDDYSPETYFRTESDEAPYVTYTLRPAEQLAAARWSKIKAKRDELKENGGVFVSGKWFHSDPYSRGHFERMTNRANYEGIADGAQYPIGGNPVPWKTMDGSYITLTAGMIRAVSAQLEIREAQIFAVATAHQMSTTSDIDTGWPARYIPA